MKFSKLLVPALIAVSAVGVFAQAPEPNHIASFAGSVRQRAVISTPAPQPTTLLTEADAERQAFDLINSQRAASGLTALEWNDEIAELARLHSRDMAKQNFFSHKSLDGSMVDDRAERLGLSAWSGIGENIAFVQGYKGPVEFAVQKWMESTGHRNNILNSSWAHSGIGVAITSDGKYYFTQVFLLRK